MYDETFGKRGTALRLMELRFRRLRLTQAAFSARSDIPVGTVEDLEQGRVKGSAALRVLIEAIALNPELIAQAAENAQP